MPELFDGIAFVCCQGDADSACICTKNESMLRRYAAGEDLRKLTDDERQWCVEEADRAGEGFYNDEELKAMDDANLAHAVLNAWRMYVQSNC